MISISIFDRIKSIAGVVTSDSFFVTLFIIMILTIVALIANMKIKSRVPKYCIAIVYSGLAVLVLARYGKYVLSLNDSAVEKVFKAIYFPNIVVYISMLFLTLLVMTIVLIDKKFSNFTKVSNFLCFFLIWFLFVLIIDSVKKQGLNFYEVIQIYSDQEIMILIQASMAVFVIWISIIIVDLIVRKLAGPLDKKQRMTNIINIVDSKNNESVDYISSVFNQATNSGNSNQEKSSYFNDNLNTSNNPYFNNNQDMNNDQNNNLFNNYNQNVMNSNYENINSNQNRW